MAPLHSRNMIVARLNVARTAALQEARRAGRATHVQTVPGRGACASCQRLAERVFTLDDAIAQPPLPCVGCTTRPDAGEGPVCRCTYRFDEGPARA